MSRLLQLLILAYLPLAARHLLVGAACVSSTADGERDDASLQA
jgi:hypothetical protein